jgi:hypothetical protein
MSAFEPYDYLPTITPDYDYTLTIKAQGTVTEEGYKNQVVHLADDNSEEVVTLSPNSIFYVSWEWGLLSESDSGTIFDLYHDPVKANGIARSFKLTAYDGHDYVVRFAMNLSRVGNNVNRWGLPSVKMRILGKVS